MRNNSRIGRILGAGLLAGAFSTTALAADKVTFQLDWLPGGDKAPIYVCVVKGICKAAGLDVKIASGRGSSEAITKIATGTADIGTAGIEALMAARAKEKVPVVAVMSLFNKGPHAFFAVKGSSIKKMADIKGKKVATSPFTSSNVFLPLVLADMGMSMKDITLIKTDPGALAPMLLTGRTDAIIAWVTNVSSYEDKAKAAGKQLEVFPWSAAGLNLYSASLVASEKFLKQRPDVAHRMIAAFKKSIEYSKANPKAAVEAIVSKVPELTPANVAGQWKDATALIFNEVTKKDGLGAFEPKRLAESWARVSKSLKLDPKSLNPESIVNRKFVPKS